MPPHPHASELEPLLDDLRATRFPDGVACPHCGCRRVVRWGRFSCRQRYRCGDCRRTFSDLTLTGAMYLKKVHLLPAYRACMRKQLSVRASARAVRVHPTTSFRWRHRLLDFAHRFDATRLSGIVEIEEGWVWCCDMLPAGTRRVRRTRMPVADWRWRRAWLIVLCDRRGRSWTEFTGRERPNGYQIGATLVENVTGEAILLSRCGRASSHAIGTRRAGFTFRSARPHGRDPNVPLEHTSRARRLLLHFRAWLRPFRGVSPKYLQNYIGWRNLNDRDRAGRHINQILEWPLPPRSTQATSLEQSLDESR